MQNTTEKATDTPQFAPEKKPARPNDLGVLNIDEHIKIFDPNDDQVFVEKRA